MIVFNRPVLLGTEENYLKQVFRNRKLSGDGAFTQKCHQWFEKNLPCKRALLTTSCTHALEMAAILSNVQPGDEVIAPAYTFVSTVNSFVLRGAKIVFVDIRPDTMNIDEKLIESAITSKTKVIIPVHYAGVACEMDTIMEIAQKYNLIVVEDAAQGVMSEYKGKSLGTIGDFGCFSFHETKNYTMGEGGALLIRDPKNIERAEIIREKGTNRSKYFRGQIDKYTWVDIGSSYLPSEINVAYLYAQLEVADVINKDRLNTWSIYHKELQHLENSGRIQLPYIPSACTHNAHIFYIKCKNLQERTELIAYLNEQKISAVFHYIPLHSSPKGSLCSRFHGDDRYTTIESERILRLPLYYGMKRAEQEYVINVINEFYSSH